MRARPRPWSRCLPALLAACLASAACFNESDHSPTAPAFRNALKLTVSATSMPADGFSRIDLLAEVDPAAAADRRTVVFTTTLGSIAGAAAATPQQLEMDADSTGRAVAQLISSTTLGRATVQAAIMGVAGVVQRAEVDFVPIDPGATLRLSSSSGSAPADGATLTQIFADIAPEIPTGSRQVDFTTNRGTFAASGTTMDSATPGASNRATVDLVSPAAAGDGRVTATVNGTSTELVIRFTTAGPEEIIVGLSKLQLQANLDDSVSITATLVRSVGTVTAGTVVSYVAVDAATGAGLGLLFRDVLPSVAGTSDAPASATATLTAGPTAFRGPAIVRATVGGVRGEARIEIVDP